MIHIIYVVYISPAIYELLYETKFTQYIHKLRFPSSEKTRMVKKTTFVYIFVKNESMMWSKTIIVHFPFFFFFFFSKLTPYIVAYK